MPTRSAYTERLHGAPTRSAYTECLHGAPTRSACTECLHGVPTRSAYTERLHGVPTEAGNTECLQKRATRSAYTECLQKRATRSAYLLSLTVGIAAVVDEAREVALMMRVNNLVSAYSHEVVVPRATLPVLLHTVLEVSLKMGLTFKRNK